MFSGLNVKLKNSLINSFHGSTTQSIMVYIKYHIVRIKKIYVSSCVDISMCQLSWRKDDKVLLHTENKMWWSPAAIWLTIQQLLSSDIVFTNSGANAFEFLENRQDIQGLNTCNIILKHGSCVYVCACMCVRVCVYNFLHAFHYS